MSLFLVFFISTYSAMHGYLLAKTWQAFRFRWPTGVVISLFFILMIISPILIRFLERGQFYFGARVAAYIGYSWMGFLLFMFTLLLLSDALRLLSITISYMSKFNLSFIFSVNRQIFLIILFCSIFISIWGFFEARNVRLNTVLIKSTKIPKEAGVLTIAQISDVHLGLIVREERLTRIAKLIRSADPDILVSTGDLVDSDIDRLNGLSHILGDIKPRLGKFAVTGNHEFYAGIEKATEFTETAGFVMLRGKGVTVADSLNIAGVDDPAGEYFHQKAIDEYELLSSLPRRNFTILLKHRPFIDEKGKPLLDLQLSGHTHRGQLFPFRYLVQLSNHFISGLYILGNGERLYVSNGSGTWGPPMRFLAPPEVTIIKLIREE